LPTNSEKTVVVNGKEEKPIRKKKLPLHVDWQKLAADKTAAREAEEAKAREQEKGAKADQ